MTSGIRFPVIPLLHVDLPKTENRVRISYASLEADLPGRVWTIPGAASMPQDHLANGIGSNIGAPYSLFHGDNTKVQALSGARAPPNFPMAVRTAVAMNTEFIQV